MRKSFIRKSLKTITILSVCIVIVLAASCARPTRVESKVEVLPPVETAVEAQLLNDAARFIAGMPGRQGGAYHALESTQAWADYSKALEKTWANAEAKQFVAVRAFEQRELKPVVSGSKFLFYPFSGPDVLYATQFFPDRTLYVMAGLEPVGNLKLPVDYHTDALPNDLQGLSTSASSIFRRSFFITAEMKSQFGGEERASDGVLPVMVLLLARSGYTFDGMRLGDINTAGEFRAQPLQQPKHQAVELVFHLASAGPRKTLYYVSTDLAGRYDPKKGFGHFVALKGPHDTLVKSASYLLHAQPFASLRKHILETSTSILQDDTGVPYRELQKDSWRVQLFGHYSAPNAPFKKKFQQDLSDAFEIPGSARELGFSIGYGYKQRTSSLILATRAAQRDAGPPGGG